MGDGGGVEREGERQREIDRGKKNRGGVGGRDRQSLEFEVWVIFVSVSLLGFQPSEREKGRGRE